MPHHIIKTFNRESQLEEPVREPTEMSAHGQVLKKEEFSRHIVASKEATDELLGINTIDDIDQVWNSLRIGSLNRREAELYGVLQPIRPTLINVDKATLPAAV